MKNLFTFQETKITQQESYYIFRTIKTITNSLVQIYQDKKNTSIPQQINFIGKFKKNIGTRMFFIAESQQNTILNSSLDSL